MIREQIRAWVNGPGDDQAAYNAAVEGLYNTVIEIARRNLAEAPDSFRSRKDPLDLASEFLIYLKQQGTAAIDTRNGLKKEFERYVTRHENPAGHELWSTLSEALHALRREGKAWRLGDPNDVTGNYNAAVWTWCEGTEGEAPCNRAEFFANLVNLRTFYPPGARRWHEEGREPKIISPSNAKILLLALLELAHGSINFGELVHAARQKVFVLTFVAEPVKGFSNTSIATIHPVSHERLFSDSDEDLVTEARRCAELIWKEICELKLTDLLQHYFLPKHFWGEKVKLPNPTSSSGDHAQKIMEVFARQLATLPLENEELSKELVRLVADEISGFCRKNPEPAPSSKEETE